MPSVAFHNSMSISGALPGPRLGLRQRKEQASTGPAARPTRCYAQADVRGSADVEDELSAGAPVPDALPSKYHGHARGEDAPVTSEQAAASETPNESDNKFSGSLKGMLLLNLGALLFGSNQVVIKTSEELLSPFALDALRFGAAALCFLPLLPRALKQRDILLPSLELGAWLTGAAAEDLRFLSRLFACVSSECLCYLAGNSARYSRQLQSFSSRCPSVSYLVRP